MFGPDGACAPWGWSPHHRAVARILVIIVVLVGASIGISAVTHLDVPIVLGSVFLASRIVVLLDRHVRSAGGIRAKRRARRRPSTS